MKRKLLIYLALSSAGCLSYAAADPPKVSVVSKDNVKTSIVRTDISKIDISSDKVKIIKHNGEEISFDKAAISKILLSEGISGIVEVEDPQIRVYPYSTDDIIHVEGAKEGERYYLIGLNGHILQSGACHEDMEISIGSQSNGVYLLVLGNNTYKIVKYN